MRHDRLAQTERGGYRRFKEQCYAACLPHCTFHGLRKAASRRLAEHGCTPHEIAAITGHASSHRTFRSRMTSRSAAACSSLFSGCRWARENVGDAA